MQGETGYPLARICRVLGIARSSVYYKPKARQERPLDPSLTERIRAVVNDRPTFGYRRVWAVLRFGPDKELVNRKTVHRIMRKKGWLCRQRPVKARPRVQQSQSRSSESNRRWAMDMTHIHCGRDGWAHLAAVLGLRRP